MTKLKLAAILVNTLFFINLYGADPKFVASLHETNAANTLLIDSISWLLDRPWRITFFNSSSSSTSSTRAASSEEQLGALYQILENEYTYIPKKTGRSDKIQRLCKGLIQYILLERYTTHNWSSIQEPIKHLSIKIIYSNYHLNFPIYILNQPGRRLEEQINNALTKLDQDFITIFPQREVPNSDTFKAVIARLLYMLNNISKLFPSIIELLNDPKSESLSNELDVIFDDA